MARYLANERVSIKFRKECIGVDAEGEPKYFLGMDFDKYPNADLLELEIKYKDEIRLLMLHQKKQSSPALAKK